jgi:hypothetical protein
MASNTINGVPFLTVCPDVTIICEILHGIGVLTDPADSLSSDIKYLGVAIVNVRLPV